ncbi:MAG TPA: O-antigen ligase family protein [bacterium]|nr:O-antigen ligase family protein [bacterium]
MERALARAEAAPTFPRISLPYVSLLVLLFAGAMLPWYTLRTMPLLTIGTAKINLVDGLAACAVLLAARPILRSVLVEREAPLLLLSGFILYMAVPLAIGLHDAGARATAVREARGLAFYALGLAFAAPRYRPADLRAFAAAYAGGTVVAVAAVFVHLRWLVALPGYTPDALLAPAGFTVQSFSWNEHVSPMPTIAVAAAAGYRIDYLDWSVPLVALLLAVAGALTASVRLKTAAWAAAALAAGWYLLVSGARSPQIVGLAAAAAIAVALGRRHAARRRVLAGIAIAVVLAGGLLVARPAGVLRGISGPLRTTVLRWGQAGGDDSLRLRVKEVAVSLPAFARHPIFGEGLGGVIPIREFAVEGITPRSIASGYGFLLVKTGLAGFALYLAVVVAVLRAAWLRIRSGRDNAVWPGARVGLVGIGALLALNLVHTVVDTPDGALAFSLFFGMIMAGAPARDVRVSRP